MRFCAARGFRRANNGTTAVEFAMVALPLLLLIFGVIEFGRALWARQGLQETAIAGARCMGLVQSPCGSSGVYSASMTMSYVQATASGWVLTLPASSVSLNPSTTCAGVSGFSQVTLTYTFQTAVPFLINALSAGVPLTATACFPNQPP